MQPIRRPRGVYPPVTRGIPSQSPSGRLGLPAVHGCGSGSPLEAHHQPFLGMACGVSGGLDGLTATYSSALP